MIIKEVTIENFRSYYGVNTVKFNDGLVLFIGDNGDGKTTFFEALEWLFDTSKQNMDQRLVSEKKLSELPEFESEILRVSMTFEHDGEKIVEKSFSFKKHTDNAIKVSDFQFKGFYDDGIQRTQIHGGVLLDRCFDAAIRKYCLFKGEENLNVFNNPDALNYLIETFSNIRQFEPYYTGDDSSPGFVDQAVEQSRKAYERAMRSDQQNSIKERDLKSKLDDIRRKLGETRRRLKTNKENATNYTIKLDEIENSKEASSILKDINERYKTLNEKKDKVEALINEAYTIKLLDEMWILCGFSSVFEEFQEKVSVFSKEKRKLEREEDIKKGKKELAKEISTGIIPLSPNIPDKISMQEMIDDEFCKVCGRDAKKGSKAYEFMVNKLNELIRSLQPEDKEIEEQLFPNNYLKELEQKSNNLEYNLDKINNLFNTIKEVIEFNESRKEEATIIQDSIDSEEEKKKKLLAQNDNLSEEQLQNAYENIRNWWDFRNDAEKQIVILEKEEIELVKNLEIAQKEYDKLATTSVASTYSKVHMVFRKIQNAFENAKEKNTQDFLLLLEEKANQYLEKLNIDGFFGIIRIIKTPDGLARVALQDRNDSFISSPNQALRTTMYMSVLFAVSELTAIKRENDYPLIFDAPTSSFAPQKESDFFNVISDINKQCIIFTKSFLTDKGSLDKDKINSLNCTIYRMEKKRPFNKVDLSTIQTKTTQIK
jgi:DNA sulfur modification protein DndD